MAKPEIFARSFVGISHQNGSSSDVDPDEAIVDDDSRTEDNPALEVRRGFPLEGDDEHGGRPPAVRHGVLLAPFAVEVAGFTQVRIVLQVWNVPAPCLITLFWKMVLVVKRVVKSFCFILYLTVYLIRLSTGNL